MYALIEDGSISKLITNPKSIVIGDVIYPAKIFQLWSQSELNTMGIYEVITDSTNKKDENWYINTNESYTFADNQVIKSWGTATPKAHADTLWTAQDELDGKGTEGKVAIRGLKYNLIKNLKEQVAGELARTDWYITRNTEKETAIPSAISTHRDAVRTKQAEMETAITNASDTPALETLYTYVNTGTEENPVYERPLGELPTLES
nr:N-acetylmuramidase/lysin [uncultured Mediterranean phage uvMED]